MTACVAFLFASCIGVKHENTIPVNITFRPVIGYDTRVEESVPFPEDQTFKFWAQQDRDGALYIEDETVSYKGSWKSSQIWPDESLSFQAYWPLNIPVTYSESKGLQINGFDCTSGDIDVLIAKAHSDFSIDGVLVLPFEHLLSRIEFRMKHSLPEDMSMRVKKITIKGYAQVGDYNVAKTNRWNSTDFKSSRVVFDVGEGEGRIIQSGEVIYMGDDFFVIPQFSEPMVEVVYEIRYNNAEWILQTSEVGPLDTEWDPSKHYTYTLNLRMDKMVYTTGISSWSNRE